MKPQTNRFRSAILILSLLCSVPPVAHAEPIAYADVHANVSPNNKTSLSACPQLYPTSELPRVLNPRLALSVRELCSDHYAVLYSGVARAPLYAVEYLTKGKILAAREFGRANDFRADNRLPKDWRNLLSDFKGSGFDRGHLAASGDMPTPAADSQSFLLSNIIAQDPQLNRNLWAAIEKAVRAHAQHRPVYVFTGTLFIGKKIERLNDRVLIPTHVYKLLYDPDRNEAAAYLVENKPDRKHREVDLSSLQELAGIEFLPNSKQIQAMKLPRPRY